MLPFADAAGSAEPSHGIFPFHPATAQRPQRSDHAGFCCKLLPLSIAPRCNSPYPSHTRSPGHMSCPKPFAFKVGVLPLPNILRCCDRQGFPRHALDPVDPSLVCKTPYSDNASLHCTSGNLECPQLFHTWCPRFTTIEHDPPNGGV